MSFIQPINHMPAHCVWPPPVTTRHSTRAVGSCVASRRSYTYTPFNDPEIPYVYPVLSAVLYPDGSQAHYTYDQIFSATRPLIVEWNDPQYALSQPHLKVE